MPIDNKWRPRHNVCTAIWRINPANDEPEMITIRTRTTYQGRVGDWRVKFPGGKQEGPNESVEATRDREVWQETSLAFLKSERIWENPVSEEHTKYGYLVAEEDCCGQLRTEPKRDESEESVDELEAPEWTPVSVLKHTLFDGHQPFLLKAMERLGLL